VASELMKCACALGYENMQMRQIQIMTKDIQEVFNGYTHEEFATLLKDGRQGKYGAIYGRINVPLFVEWERKKKSSSGLPTFK
jgi:hypothetical protein